MSNTDSELRVRDVAFAAIQRLADHERSTDPSLSEPQALLRAVGLPAGQELAALYSSPDSLETIRKAALRGKERDRLRELGFDSYAAAVEEAANTLSPDDFGEGMGLVAKRYPHLYAAYLEECTG